MAPHPETSANFLLPTDPELDCADAPVLAPQAGPDKPGLSPTALRLADGTTVDLAGMSRRELMTLQWEQERAFARQILAAPKGSAARAAATRRAYDTVPRIFAAVEGLDGAGPAMGYHPRQGRLVIARLARHRRRGRPATLFEIGYGNGAMVKQVADAGFEVAGIEVAATLHDEACRLVGPGRAAQLYVGDFLREVSAATAAPFGVVYWNDVFEHIPPDEILEYLRRIHQMLAPGGELVTVTPNWHMRPADVTADIVGPRAEPVGLHLKEYTLGEVTRLLHQAGFRRVFVPLAVTHQRIVLGGSGLAGLKRLLEPGLERLPYRLARLLCRGLGLSTTIAVK